ncbi:protein FAM9A-like [Nerophis ophidion]|uniref:protein FAM9A-like n=1 Tax=Nerophis ophidion TaxID=159077 RepID=UPI002AE038CC|nr:protein FAM9A-like [Nerophis ophidion]
MEARRQGVRRREEACRTRSRRVATISAHHTAVRNPVICSSSINRGKEEQRGESRRRNPLEETDHNNEEAIRPRDDATPQQTQTLDPARKPVTVAPTWKRRPEAEGDDVIWALVASYKTLLKEQRQETQRLQALMNQVGGNGEDIPEGKAEENASGNTAENLHMGSGAVQAAVAASAVAAAGHQSELLAKEREDEFACLNGDDIDEDCCTEEAPCAGDTYARPVERAAGKVEEEEDELNEENDEEEEVEDEEGEDEEEVEKFQEKEEVKVEKN